MRALFGTLSLLVVLAVVGLVVVRQMKTLTSTSLVSPGAAGVAGLAATPASGTIRQQSDQIQQKVLDDLDQAARKSMDARENADK